MSVFWGYVGADWLAGVTIAVASAACLFAALRFVRGDPD